MIKSIISIKLILTVALIFNLGCSHQEKSALPDSDRTIASIGTPSNNECINLLEKFLPNHNRINTVESVEGFTKIKYAVPSELRPALKDVSEKAEFEASDVFNSFTKANKDLASEGKFKLLVDPHESLMARIMLIRDAKKTIDLTYYIFQDSETSKLLIGELRQAIRRGVDVRLMVDGSGSLMATTNFFKEIQVLTHTIGGKIYDAQGNVLRNAKFEAIEINPTFNVRANIKSWYNKIIKMVSGKEVPQDDFSLFHRSHDKILLVDAASPENSKAIVGGRNISNHYYKIGTEADRDSTFNDLDILVKNIAFTETKDEKEVIRNVLLEHFNRLYYYSANKNFEDFIFKIGREKASETLGVIRKTRNQLIRGDGAELAQTLAKMESDDFLNQGFDKGYISFLDEIQNLVRKNSLSNLSYENNKNSIIKNMWEQLDKAEKDILICSPYVYLTDKEINKLVNWLAADKSRTFRLITNSTATSDNLFAQAMVENFVMPKLLGKLKEKGINPKQFEILAYGNLNNKDFGGTIAQGKLHAKFWMVDNYSMGVGTSNFDPVSRLTNSEIVANIFPTEGKQSIETLNRYYASLKDSSSHWNSPDFVEAKFRPELKKKLMIQSFITKVMNFFKILPQD